MARVLANVEELRTDRGCLISKYSLGSHGYPQVGWLDVQSSKKRMTLCHRVVWASRFGGIPAGMTVDHKCKVRRCLEVDHLRLIPNLENARRTRGRDWPLGQCINGHDDARYWHKPASGGKGYCNECRRLAQRRLRAARAAER